MRLSYTDIARHWPKSLNFPVQPLRNASTEFNRNYNDRATSRFDQILYMTVTEGPTADGYIVPDL